MKIVFIHFPVCPVKGDISLSLFPVLPRMTGTETWHVRQNPPGPAQRLHPLSPGPRPGYAACAVRVAHVCPCVSLALTPWFAGAARGSPDPRAWRGEEAPCGLRRWAQHVLREVTCAWRGAVAV